MIARIAQNDTIFKPAAQRAQSCPIGHVARGEQQSRFFIVQICQFPLKQQVIMICPWDIARATSSGAAAGDSLAHRFNHHGILSHAKVIIGTPDGHILHLAIMMTRRMRKFATFAL